MPKETRAGGNKRKNRIQPTGLPSVAEAAQNAEDEISLDESELEEQQNVPIFQKLQSSNETDREVACNGIANLVLEEEEAVRIALEEESLKRLVHCLADPSTNVRIAAAGALNNLSTVTPAPAFPLFHRHATATLLSVLQQHLRLANDTTVTRTEEETKQLTSLMAQILSLLSTLSENSEDATNMILQAGTLGLVISFLRNFQSVPAAILTPSAALLQVLSDCDNDQVLNRWLSADDRTALVNLLVTYISSPSPDARFASHIAASIVNMGGGKNPQVLQPLVSALELCWRFDGLSGLIELATFLQQSQQEQKVSEETIKTAEKVLEKWRSNMAAQQSAFEILTNICVCSADESSGSVDEAALEEEETVDEATVMAVNMDEATAMAPEVLAALPIPTIMAKVVEKLQWDRVKVTELGQAFIFMKKCVVNFHAVQARALSCLNNMLLVMPLPSDKQQAEGLWDLVVRLCAEAGQPLPPPLGNEANIEVLELVTACMWTLLRKATQRGYPLSPHSAVVEGMVQLAAGCPSFEARTNALGCLGIMGQHPQLLSLAPKVAAVLVHSVGTSLAAQGTAEQPWSGHGSVVAEGLNSIFDMFSEEDKDSIFAQLGLLAKLRVLSPQLRNKIRQEGRALDRDLVERLKETKLNLDRFIQYKAQHIK